MNKLRTIIILGLAFLSGACNPSEEQQKFLVVTSIAPLGAWISAVGGPDVEVLILVPPSSSPHTFELSPGQLRQASRANLVVLNGAGLEYWSERLLENLQNPKTPVLTLSENVQLLQDGHADGHISADASAQSASPHSDDAVNHTPVDADHGHGAAGNPHFWLDPTIASASVTRIAEALVSLLPGKKDSMLARAATYKAALTRLDTEIHEAVNTWRQKRFIGDHSAWVYFARRYGLDEAGVIEAIPGREVSARELSSIINLMKRDHVSVVFADGRKSMRAADILAEETGARIARLNPMGISGNSYLELLRSNVKEMARVMK
ncbi:MAG: metal ABC transporter substrate-binding protein [Bacteroidota bacterium]